MLQVQTHDSHEYSQLLSYDTTFKLGNFYVSPLLFRNILFETKPVMPSLFMIHERKLKATHDELMRVVSQLRHSLINGSNTIPLVTADEKGFDAINGHLHKLCRLYFWNHIINASKIWLRGHGATSSEIPVYVNNIRNLLHQPSEDEYQKHLTELKGSWSQPFVRYYMSEIHSKVN